MRNRPKTGEKALTDEEATAALDEALAHAAIPSLRFSGVGSKASHLDALGGWDSDVLTSMLQYLPATTRCGVLRGVQHLYAAKWSHPGVSSIIRACLAASTPSQQLDRLRYAEVRLSRRVLDAPDQILWGPPGGLVRCVEG